MRYFFVANCIATITHRGIFPERSRRVTSLYFFFGMQQKKSEKERGDAIIFLALWSKYVYAYFQQSLMKKKNVVFKELTQTQFNLCRRESFDPLIKN